MSNPSSRNFVQNGVDRPSRLLRFVTFVHLPFTFRSLGKLEASLDRAAVENFKRS